MTLKKIFIVDDDVYIGDMLEEILTKEGYSVSRAYSGTEAALLLSVNKPDLVLLDLMLPGLSGEKVLEKIKDIPVIVVSAKIDVNDKVNLLLGGAADYITKPFDTKELLARITVQLRDKKSERTIAPTVEYDDIVLDTTARRVTVCFTNKRRKKILRQLPCSERTYYARPQGKYLRFCRQKRRGQNDAYPSCLRIATTDGRGSEYLRYRA